MKTLADLQVKANVVGIMPMTENAISHNSYKPGDIVKSMSGKTVQIENTDAEGRLILADAITYVQKKYDPETIIDFATLTGSIIATFDEYICGLFTNDDGLAKEILQRGKEEQERFWQLPVYQEFYDAMKGDRADLANLSSLGKNAGAITGAAFIGSFVDKKKKWAHLDIAGTSFYTKKIGCFEKGASGFGLKTIVNLIDKMRCKNDLSKGRFTR
jgi:leucyl aminopeptidase